MNLPNLPTDSLYKFVCMSGLLLALACPIYYGQYSDSVLAKEMVVNMKIVETKASIRFLGEDVDALKEELKRNIGAQKDLAGAKEAQAELQKQVRFLKIEVDRLAQMVEEQDMLKMRLAAMFWGSVLGVAAGVTIFFAGLNYWYRRIQVHQDAILRIQSQERA